jgi:hypothetical protein
VQTKAKDLYLKPELTIYEFSTEDIIITSTLVDNETDDNWDGDWV